ncbi:isoamylase early set domain-containing protein [Fulvivirga lutimaris]|uniref:isoamylase early set domain-containing protein n=1 Tax=Fulvivirga lutimaris TaxID=1819566 RepID=UPI0012BD7B67|nr:isoamylase early set domain-containing protein [Fulvivirga lutimaris]MTI41460.1 glycoside hydrolase [Fulvivirga lutimaris]
MAIKKQYLKSKPVAKVTLSLPAEAAPQAKDVKVLGDFTSWTKGVEMKKLKSGEFKATIELPVEHTYQFRYLVDNKVWVNDWDADAYVNSGVSSEDNSVVIL